MFIAPTPDTIITVDFDEKSKSFYFLIVHKGEVIHSQKGFSHPSTARVTANMWLHQYEKKIHNI